MVNKKKKKDIDLNVLFRTFHDNFQVKLFPPKKKIYTPYTPYAGAAGMLLHMNGKFTVGKLKSSLLS